MFGDRELHFILEVPTNCFKNLFGGGVGGASSNSQLCCDVIAGCSPCMYQNGSKLQVWRHCVPKVAGIPVTSLLILLRTFWYTPCGTLNNARHDKDIIMSGRKS